MLVGLGSMNSVEVVVVIHCKCIAGPLSHGSTGPAYDEVDMLVGDGHRMARDAAAANNEARREGGNILP